MGPTGRLHAVIGAQYGDEGKGVVTDYLATPDTLVVRYNGGAQAGHTVVTPDGRRHVFQHFGAGTLRGAKTMLSRFFLVNPATFVPEFHRLVDLCGMPVVYADPRALVTTPYDMLLNRAAEDARDGCRHGSCGLGVNETVTRSQRGFPLTVADLVSERALPILRNISESWVPFRAKALGIDVPALARASCTIPRFLLDIQIFTSCVRMWVEDHDAVNLASHVVFEGAQGLRLDECAEGFPHVTRSRTGLPNIVTILQDADKANTAEPLHVHYVTRSYVTRHGHGPLAQEFHANTPVPWDTSRETNVMNAYQGRFRYATLNPADLAVTIAMDRAHGQALDLRRGLVVTCQDQLMLDARALADRVGVSLDAQASGPSRDYVRWHEP